MVQSYKTSNPFPCSALQRSLQRIKRKRQTPSSFHVHQATLSDVASPAEKR